MKLPENVSKSARRRPCALCGGGMPSPKWDKKEWACKPCWNGYVNFRRAFKLEHGRFPTIEEVRADEVA